MKEFPKEEVAKFQEDEKEEWMPCFTPVPTEFLDKIDLALNEIESYIKRTHRGKFSFEAVAADRTLRCILLTIKSPGAKQTLWVLRECEDQSYFSIYCKTLYEVARISHLNV